MARRPRIDPEGGWHHVMNRGAGRRDVFQSERDGRQFLRLIGEGCADTGVEVHAYCLMGNHYHLLLHCPAGGLSGFMLRVGSMYTRYVNWHLNSDGPIFRGRFHSLLVDTPEYRICAARYIHRNPLDLRPPVALDRYRWSSFGAYVGAAVAPEWLATESLLAAHGSTAGLRVFVEDDLVCGRGAAIDWAIDTTIAELDDHGLATTPHIRRAIAVAMFDRAEQGTKRTQIEQWLGFPSADALRMALVRSRARTMSNPEMVRAAERALGLVA